ncbi:MAG: Hsp20/alpha crystallin family protein [Burkholderiales bacterium]
MANLTRFNPFDDTLDDLFRGFFVRPVALEGDRQQAVQIRIDVKEDANAYTVHAEIPGVKKEDIQINVEGNQVAISAEVKRNREDKQGERVLRTERYYGKVSRGFSLASEVDSSGAQAKYADGVLELVLPKKQVNAARQIAVQ